MYMNKNLIRQLSKKANRIVVTQDGAFNPKRKRENKVLADIRGSGVCNIFGQTIKVDCCSKAYPDLMTLPVVYLNFLEDRILIFEIGILIDNWIRSESWEGDYAIDNTIWFHDWLIEQGVSYFDRGTE